MNNMITETAINASTEQALKHILANGYTVHHTARKRGYVSRKQPDGILIPYSGRFGTGYMLLQPAWDSTQYCFCTYYTKVGA